MAMFINAFQDLVAEKRSSGELKTGSDETFRVKAVYEPRAIRLPEKITQAFVEEMADRMNERNQRLSRESFLRLLAAATDVLGKEPNIVHLPRETKLTVVGDIHGGLLDLCLIFEMAGWPGPGNKFLFNGDFVDRGTHSVEVLSILLALKVLHPDSVFLNRGNHEDLSVGRAYGFFDEVIAKYQNPEVYAAIGKVFVRMPLCTVLDKRALIVHAGVPCSKEDATIYHVGAIAREAVRSTVVASWDGRDADGRWRKRPQSLSIVEDMLWSDPIDPQLEPGSEDIIERNFIRQAGSRYGVGLIQKWCNDLSVQCVVRSHEMVMGGVEEMKCGNGKSLWTVFSCSHYQESGNDGGYLVFPACKVGEPSPLPQPVIFHPRGDCSVKASNREKMVDLICRNKPALTRAFKEAAGDSKTISLDVWDKILREVLQLDVDFKHHRTDLAGRVKLGMADLIDVADFLRRYKVQVQSRFGSKLLIEDDHSMGLLFSNRRELGAIFQLMDRNNDGKLSREEVQFGCEMLNKKLPGDIRIDADQVFDLMDTNKSGMVNVDEFVAAWSSDVMSSLQHPAL